MLIQLLLVPLFSALLFVAGAALEGKVVGVSDGDTFTLLTKDKTQVKIRLNGVDCPESRMAFGQRAKQFTSSFIFGKDVTIIERDRDRYGRVVADVYVDSLHLNRALVDSGFAWWYQQYARGDSVLARAERAARENKRGLWADPHPIPPWEWRHGGAQTQRLSPAPSVPLPDGGIEETAAAANDPAVVFNTSSKKIHYPSCSAALKCTKNCIETTRSQAVARGGVACGICGGRCN